jgi:uncharacterized protein YbbK (DUF523 family)
MTTNRDPTIDAGPEAVAACPSRSCRVCPWGNLSGVSGSAVADPGGKILVSACLLGRQVRYDGGAKTCLHPRLLTWLQAGRVVPFCPEVEGGLAVPRPRAELTGGDGASLWAGAAAVLDEQGADVTAAFRRGAEAALAVCQREGIRLAVLKEGSPSCGRHRIADGTFSGASRPGLGVTAALLVANGIAVLSEEDL